MAVQFTISLTDDEERVLNWYTERLNATRLSPVNLAPPVTDPPAPLTPAHVVDLAVRQQLTMRAEEYAGWKGAMRAGAIAKLPRTEQADIDARLNLVLEPPITATEGHLVGTVAGVPDA